MMGFDILGALAIGGLIGACIGWAIKWALIKTGIIKPDEEE
jgi:uncharacterized membrane protein (Fun14 family)